MVQRFALRETKLVVLPPQQSEPVAGHDPEYIEEGVEEELVQQRRHVEPLARKKHHRRDAQDYGDSALIPAAGAASSRQ